MYRKYFAVLASGKDKFPILSSGNIYQCLMNHLEVCPLAEPFTHGEVVSIG